MSIWDTDKRLREELALMRQSLDAQIRGRDVVRPRRPRLPSVSQTRKRRPRLPRLPNVSQKARPRPRLQRFPSTPKKDYWKVIRDFAIDFEVVPPPVVRVVPLPKTLQRREMVMDVLQDVNPFGWRPLASRYSSERPQHRGARRTPRRMWTDGLQEVDVFYE